MGLLRFLRNYFDNSKRVLRSYNNPLKKPENTALKDTLESEFYDREARDFLKDFDEDLFRYDPDEKYPPNFRYFFSLLENVEGNKVLETGCGHGFASIKCVKQGATAVGIDISPEMIRLARKNAEFNQVTEGTSFELMSAQDMSLQDDSFDMVIGSSTLHHLTIESAGKEISRVLKPGGKAIFIEPRIPFKWLVFVRSIFPNRCDESPGGAQMNDQEIRAFSQNFSTTEITYFILFSKLSRLPLIGKLNPLLEKLDAFLIRKIPLLRKFTWSFVLVFTR